MHLTCESRDELDLSSKVCLLYEVEKVGIDQRNEEKSQKQRSQVTFGRGRKEGTWSKDSPYSGDTNFHKHHLFWRLLLVC